MSFRVTVRVDEPEVLAGIVGSMDRGKVAGVVAPCAGSLGRLVDGEYEAGGEDDGSMVQAFDAVCAAVCGPGCTVETALEEEETPEMWRLAWGSEAVPFELPLSSFGVPAVSYWGPEAVDELMNGVEEEVVAVLRAARAAGRGVLVFVSE